MKRILFSFLFLISCGRQSAPVPAEIQGYDQETRQTHADIPTTHETVTEKPTSHSDCSGLISNPDVGEIGAKRIRKLGAYAAGSMAGNSFIPIMYFHNMKDARSCVGDEMMIMKWDGNSWVEVKK